MVFSLIILISSLSLVHGYAFSRCLLHKGECVAHCPQLMHPYHTKCDGQTLSQMTCRDPKQWILGYTCGWSRCDCNANYLLDEETGTCVELEYCTQPFTRRRNKARSGVRKKSLRVKINDKFDIAEDALGDD